MDGETACAAWVALFSKDRTLEVGSSKLSYFEPPLWVPRLGLVARLFLERAGESHYRQVLVARPEEAADVKAIGARVRAALAAAPAETPLADIVLGLPDATVDATIFSPTPADEARRAAALEIAFERFPAVAARMQTIYGLRLPRHLAVWAGFYRSLTPLERRGLDSIEWGPVGVAEWFEDGKLERTPREGLDERLECRFRRDPPELVTVGMGGSDGLHYGLWYDDPAELPSFIASNWARDTAETHTRGATMLAVLDGELRRRIEQPDYPEEPIPVERHALWAAVKAFARADARALEQDGRSPWSDADRDDILGGLGPAVPEDAGDPCGGWDAGELRSAIYDANPAALAKLIEQARAELSAGEPAFALTLGRELHWLDERIHQPTALELLTSAYEALGRHALADIARVHHAHRDLPFVSVY
jgi:hypothetical protein